MELLIRIPAIWVIEKKKHYVPGFPLGVQIPKRSSLNSMQHSEFLRLFLMYKNKPMPSFLSVGQNRDMHLFKMLNELVVKEQMEFMAFAKTQWCRLSMRCNVLNSHVKRYVEESWQHRLCRVYSYPRFYRQYGQPIPLVYAPSRPDIQLELVENLLELGEPLRLILPCFPAKICTDYGEMIVEYPPAGCEQESNSLYKVSVSQDKNAEYFAGVRGAEVVISSSGLQCIMNNMLPFEKPWTIPVIVRELKYQEGSTEKTRKVVFIDKALPPKTMTATARNVWYHKRGVKMLVCQPRFKVAKLEAENSANVPDVSSASVSSSAPAVKTADTPSSKVLKVTAKNEVNSGYTSNDDESVGTDDSQNLIIDYNSGSEGESNDHNLKKSACSSLAELSLSSPLDSTPQWTSPIKDPRKQFTPSLSTHDKSSSNPTKHQESLISQVPADEQFIKMQPASKTFVTYRLWNLSPAKRNKEDLREDFLKGLGNSRDIKMIVRCKVDANQLGNESSPVCVFPKLEYQYEYGAEVFTPSEVVSQWTALQFRPNAKLVRVRVDAINSEVMMTETISQQSLVAEASQHQFRVRSSSLGTLYSILSHLVDLPIGHYLLSHTSRSAGFVNLFTNHPEDGEYDLHMDYSHVDTKTIPEIVHPWIPLDPNVVTPLNKTLKHIPVTFLPKPYKVNTKKKMKK